MYCQVDVCSHLFWRSLCFHAMRPSSSRISLQPKQDSHSQPVLRVDATERELSLGGEKEVQFVDGNGLGHVPGNEGTSPGKADKESLSQGQANQIKSGKHKVLERVTENEETSANRIKTPCEFGKSFVTLNVVPIVPANHIPCQNSKYGCRRMLTAAQENAHKTECKFFPFSCPITACKFSSPRHDFPAHFMESHEIQTVEAGYPVFLSINLVRSVSYLLIKVEDTLFLLHHQPTAIGWLMYLSFFGWSSHWENVSYSLDVDVGKKRLFMESNPQSVSGGNEHDFLCVPSHAYSQELGQVRIKLQIENSQKTL